MARLRLAAWRNVRCRWKFISTTLLRAGFYAPSLSGRCLHTMPLTLQTRNVLLCCTGESRSRTAQTVNRRALMCASPRCCERFHASIAELSQAFEEVAAIGLSCFYTRHIIELVLGEFPALKLPFLTQVCRCE